MTTVSDDRRPARRSTGQPWLDRKYSQQPADPRLTAWADAAVDQLYGAWTMLSVGPYDSQQKAQRAKNALYDAVYKRWNREHPDELLSLSANVTDPADGKCYARGQCRCEQNECKRLGHANVTVTLATHSHVMPGDQRQAAARFAALVGGAEA